jgi:hypothetical protein
MPTAPASPLVALDANVVMDLGEGCDAVLDASRLNDSLLVAEAALLQAHLLLSSDDHLRGMDFARLSLELHNFDVTAPVIATPAEVARKFFPR